jgi:hypothetical protein
MATLVSSKYSLKTLHEDIGLLDRKIAHLHKYEVFRSDSDRDAAAAKIAHKRDLLVRQARLMVDEGIQFQTSDVPQSLRDADDHEGTPEAMVEASPDVPATVSKRKTVKPSSPFSGTVLDATQALQEYKQKKGKRLAPVTQPTHAAESAAAS